MKHASMIRRIRAAAAAIALAALGAASLQASSAARADERDIVGTWLIEVTLRNCSTGAQLSPSIPAIVTFHHGGTITESAAPVGFAVGQRTPAQGTWERDGDHSYVQKMVALITFDTAPNPPASPGFFAGWQTVEHWVDQTDADSIASSGTNAFYRTDGQVYRTGCSTAVGRRFE